MIEVILIEPNNSGNLGAIARVLKNFNIKNLTLISPKCKKDSQTAKNRAKHAQDILKNAKIKTIKYLKTRNNKIATTAKLARDYNVLRSPIPIDKIKRINKDENLTLVFGRESNGLTNKEIEMCDYTVTIPTNKEYPTLNLSHAVAITLYELTKNNQTSNNHIQPPSKEDKDHLISLINNTIDKLKFQTVEKEQTQRIVWKKIINKTEISRRELFALFGFFKKLKK